MLCENIKIVFKVKLIFLIAILLAKKVEDCNLGV